MKRLHLWILLFVAVGWALMMSFSAYNQSRAIVSIRAYNREVSHELDLHIEALEKITSIVAPVDSLQ